jgi:hypothetical protein
MPLSVVRQQRFKEFLKFAWKVTPFIDNPLYFSHCSVNTSSMKKLAYLADISKGLNELNLSCQGESTTIFGAIKQQPFKFYCVGTDFKGAGSCKQKIYLKKFPD